MGKLDLDTGPSSHSGCNPYIDIQALADKELLQISGSIKSADITQNTTATNTTAGHFGWDLDENGEVASIHSFSDADGAYP